MLSQLRPDSAISLYTDVPSPGAGTSELDETHATTSHAPTCLRVYSGFDSPLRHQP